MFQTDGRRRRSRPLVSIVGAVIVILLLAACAGSTAQPLGGAPANFGKAEPPTDQGRSVGGTVLVPGASSAPDTQPVNAQRHVIKTGEVTLEVPNVANALGRVRALALELGGYVGGSQAGTLDQSATLTLRIPAARFDDALSKLHAFDGKVIVEATRQEDVTGSIVDLTARIDNLQASETQYRALLARAQKIEDILSVQSRLDQVRGEIEQLKGQLKSVGDQADMSTLTVTLTPRAQPVQAASAAWDPGATASQALASLLEIGQGIASGAIWFAIVWLPILLILTFLVLLALRGLLELRRRMPRSELVAEEPPAGCPARDGWAASRAHPSPDALDCGRSFKPGTEMPERSEA